jgi:hypothetical protein
MIKFQLSRKRDRLKKKRKKKAYLIRTREREREREGERVHCLSCLKEFKVQIAVANDTTRK